MGEPGSTPVRQATDLLVKSAAPAADPLETMKGAFERLAVRCTEIFGELAPVPMELSLGRIEPSTLGDAHAGWGESSLVAVFQSPDKSVQVLIGADIAFVNAALDAVLGSDGSEPAGAGRGTTRIGMRLARSLFQHVIDELRPALLGGKSAPFEIDSIDTAANLPAPARRDEPSVTATFGFSTLERGGELFLILPQAVVQGVGQPGSAGGQSGASPATGDNAWSRRIEQEVHRTEVTLHAVLDERELTLGEIAELRIGQVIPLKATPRSNVKVVCNDQTMFWCELGQAGGIYTLRIKDFPDQEQELIDAIASG